MTVRDAIAIDLGHAAPPSARLSAPAHPLQLEAVRLVRDIASAMERRILEQASPDGAAAREPDAVPPLQALQDQLVHLARVAALGTLAASIAHEIRQPLTAIRVETYAIQRWMNRDTPNTAEVAEGVRRIQDQSERAEQVIRSLRALMRREPTERHPFALDQAILELLPLVAARVYDADVTLAFDLDPTLPALHGNRVQIQQVVMNLLLNAIDASRGRPHGGAAIAVRTSGDGERGLSIEVSDNGHGIDPARIDQVFAPFVSTKADGMGIGLAICRMIVEAHGGTIGAASGQGQTTMTVRLPLDGVSGLAA